MDLASGSVSSSNLQTWALGESQLYVSLLKLGGRQAGVEGTGQGHVDDATQFVLSRLHRQ